MWRSFIRWLKGKRIDRSLLKLEIDIANLKQHEKRLQTDLGNCRLALRECEIEYSALLLEQINNDMEHSYEAMQ